MSNVSEVVSYLRTTYQFDKTLNLIDFLSLPSSTLAIELVELKKEQFAENERIIFTCFDNVDNNKILELLVHLQKHLTFFDIPNFFVLIATNNQFLVNQLESIRSLHSLEEIPIGHYLNLNVPMTSTMQNHSALISPPESICAQPWVSLDVGADGTFRPCCFFVDAVTKSDGTLYHASTDSIVDVYNSVYMNQLRQDFRDGKKPAGCIRCWKEESNNSVSKRQLLKYRFPPASYYTNYEQDNVNNLSFVSIAFGSVCNYKCRICSSTNSTKIAEEELANSTVSNKKSHPAYLNLKQGIWIKQKDAELWSSINDPSLNILYFDFAGGEPLLAPSHYSILTKFIDDNRSHQMSLRYNTNGSVFPIEHVHLWHQFKHVSIDISVDNLGARFNYERSGGDWDTVVNNLNNFFLLQNKKFEVNLHLAVSIMNVFYLPEICAWINTQKFNNVHFSTLYYPSILNISHVTNAARDIILNKISNYNDSNPVLDKFVKNIVNILETATLSDGVEFCIYMKKLDNYRNEDFANLYPEIAKAMGY